MWKILQHDKPDDFVIGTGESHSVKEFVEKAFSYAGLDWNDHVRIDPKYFRPTEVESLIADQSKSKKLLGWEPKIKFNDLVKIMMDADLRACGMEPIGEGDIIIKSKFKAKWWGVD
jgi:GDPmannose 4,6-dehydratase